MGVGAFVIGSSQISSFLHMYSFDVQNVIKTNQQSFLAVHQFPV